MKLFLLEYFDTWKVVLGWAYVGGRIGLFISVMTFALMRTTDELQKCAINNKPEETAVWAFITLLVVIGALLAKAWWLHRMLWLDSDEVLAARARERVQEAREHTFKEWF